MKRPLLVFTLATIFAICGCKSPDTTRGRHFDTLIIQGTPQFQEQVTKALTLLKTRSRDGYATATNYIGIIQQHEHSGMEVHRRPPVFQLNDKSANYSVTWCAGVIAHDSIHSKLYFDYKKQHPWLWVRPEIHSGENAELACIEHQLAVLKDIGAPTNEIDWCRQSKTNEYWKVKYRNRNW
jgi:hypothetical protein